MRNLTHYEEVARIRLPLFVDAPRLPRHSSLAGNPARSTPGISSWGSSIQSTLDPATWKPAGSKIQQANSRKLDSGRCNPSCKIVTLSPAASIGSSPF